MHGTWAAPSVVHLEHPPGSGRRACDGEWLVPHLREQGAVHRLCVDCRLLALRLKLPLRRDDGALQPTQRLSVLRRLWLRWRNRQS